MLRCCPDGGRYTLQEACPSCGEATRDPAPATFSPDDDYGEYRRRLKRMNEDADRGST
jgi:H/ACA ribonucleoprotein complex subunit 3